MNEQAIKSFKDLNISVPDQQKVFFTGDKIKIRKILDRQIVVLDYKISDSKYTDKCLQMQIAMGETKHVVFTGSKNLLDVIQEIPKEGFPFRTIIEEKADNSFVFT